MTHFYVFLIIRICNKIQIFIRPNHDIEKSNKNVSKIHKAPKIMRKNNKNLWKKSLGIEVIFLWKKLYGCKIESKIDCKWLVGQLFGKLKNTCFPVLVAAQNSLQNIDMQKIEGNVFRIRPFLFLRRDL